MTKILGRTDLGPNGVDSIAVSLFVAILVELANADTLFVNSTYKSTNIETAMMSNMEDLCDPSRSSILEIKRANRLSNIQDRVHGMLVCSLNIVKGKVGQQEIIGSLSSQ